MRRNLKKLSYISIVGWLLYSANAFAANTQISDRPKISSSERNQELSEQQSLEMLSLGEYWGLRTDIDAAQGGDGERSVIDLQYNWDSAASAAKEEEAFSQAEKDKNNASNTSKP